MRIYFNGTYVCFHVADCHIDKVKSYPVETAKELYSQLGNAIELAECISESPRLNAK